MIDELLSAIKQANLPAPVYRTAREILDRTASNGYARLSYAAAMAIVQTDKPETLRGHLAQLQAAGLITYRRNEEVHVMWHLHGARGDIQGARLDIQNARTDAATATDDSSNLYTQPNNLYTQPRAARGVPTPYLSKDPTSKEVSKGDPTYLPAVDAAGEPQPLTDQERSIDLLTDSAVGCTPDFAAKLAALYPFAQIRLQVFQALRQMAQPGSKVTSIGVIAHRLKVNAAATLTPEDQRSALWLRHETPADRERKYSLDGLTDAERAARDAAWAAEVADEPDPAPKPAKRQPKTSARQETPNILDDIFGIPGRDR
jgi:hypothetical protein